MEKIFKYIDDFLVFDTVTDSKREICLASKALFVYEKSAQGPKFAMEFPERTSLSFPVLTLNILSGHTCWLYEPRSKIGLQPYCHTHYIEATVIPVKFIFVRDSTARKTQYHKIYAESMKCI